MKYTTSITDIRPDGHEYIRGTDLNELIANRSFAWTIFLLLTGREPNEAEEKMTNACFVAAIDHGPGTASGQVARITASAKNSMHTSVAAGILSMGERHGSALEGAMEFFQEHKDEDDVAGLVKRLKESKVRVPGFGHAILEHDERSASLFAVARDLGLFQEHCAFAVRFHEELNVQSSKTLPINIDGSLAAIFSDMGFDAKLGKGLFMIARVPGLVAQVHEEVQQNNGIRRVDQDDIVFEG